MKVASITELEKEGWNKNVLLQIAHAKGSPAVKTPGGGKWLFDLAKFEKFVEQRLRQSGT